MLSKLLDTPAISQEINTRSQHKDQTSIRINTIN